MSSSAGSTPSRSYRLANLSCRNVRCASGPWLITNPAGYYPLPGGLKNGQPPRRRYPSSYSLTALGIHERRRKRIAQGMEMAGVARLIVRRGLRPKVLHWLPDLILQWSARPGFARFANAFMRRASRASKSRATPRGFPMSIRTRPALIFRYITRTSIGRV